MCTPSGLRAGRYTTRPALASWLARANSNRTNGQLPSVHRPNGRDDRHSNTCGHVWDVRTYSSLSEPEGLHVVTEGVIGQARRVPVAFRLVRDSPGERMTPQRIDELRRKGMTQNEIAQFFGVSRQAVSKMKHHYGNFTETPRERILRNYPFKHGSEHNQSAIFRRLKEHGLYMAGGPWALSAGQRRDLNRFYNRLRSQSLIVEYDPTVLPSPGNKYGGYTLVPRTKDDSPNSLIRRNEHAHVTEEAERFGFWKFPPEDPPA